MALHRESWQSSDFRLKKKKKYLWQGYYNWFHSSTNKHGEIKKFNWSGIVQKGWEGIVSNRTLFKARSHTDFFNIHILVNHKEQFSYVVTQGNLYFQAQRDICMVADKSIMICTILISLQDNTKTSWNSLLHQNNKYHLGNDKLYNLYFWLPKCIIFHSIPNCWFKNNQP